MKTKLSPGRLTATIASLSLLAAGVGGCASSRVLEHPLPSGATEAKSVSNPDADPAQQRGKLAQERELGRVCVENRQRVRRSLRDRAHQPCKRQVRPARSEQYRAPSTS
jgi:hypothetical protein